MGGTKRCNLWRSMVVGAVLLDGYALKGRGKWRREGETMARMEEGGMKRERNDK